MYKSFMHLVTASALTMGAASADQHNMSKDSSSMKSDTPAMAAESSSASDWGFYVGGAVGAAFGDARIRTQSVAAALAPNNTPQAIFNREQDIFGVVALFAGVNYQMSEDFYVGFEAEINVDSLKLRDFGDDTRLVGAQDYVFDISRKFQAIPSLVLGYKTTATSSVYAKLGASITRFEFIEGLGQVVSNTVRSTKVHFVPAIGVHADLNENLAARLELSAEVIGSKPNSNSAAPGGFPNQRSTAKHNVYAMKLGFIWKL